MPSVTPPAVTDGGNQFTRLNVIGMFLTLQLCQLTQPYGSLLFRGVSGYFWRCNPISSFVEACIIFWHLGVVIIQSWKEGRPTMRKRLQETSAGLLLLRGAIGKDDVSGLMQKLMTGSFLDKEEEVDTPVPDTSQTSSNRQEEATATGIQSNTPQPVSRQPTLEANRASTRTNTMPAFHPDSEKSRILREAFGSNALAHKELRIDLFTAFTEITIFIKLVTISGNGWFTGAGIFLVFGWWSVHILLVLFHLREMDEIEMAAAVRIARIINAELKEQAFGWNSLFVVLHLPFFGYPAYLAAFNPWFPEDATGIEAYLRNFAIRIPLSVAIAIIPGIFVPSIGSIVRLLRIKGFVQKLAFMLIFLLFSASLAVSGMSYMLQQLCVESLRLCPETFTSFFTPQTPMYYIVDESFEVVYNVVWLLLILALVSAVYFRMTIPIWDVNARTSSNSASVERKISSAGNTLFVLVVFVLYLIWYDPSKTSKQTWTDLLG
jgi:hypothetical protein